MWRWIALRCINAANLLRAGNGHLKAQIENSNFTNTRINYEFYCVVQSVV